MAINFRSNTVISNLRIGPLSGGGNGGGGGSSEPSYLIVSAIGDDDQGDRAGAVYVYDATNYSAAPTKLAPSGLDAIDFFSVAIAISSNQLIVGARYDDDQGDNAGSSDN